MYRTRYIGHRPRICLHDILTNFNHSHYEMMHAAVHVSLSHVLYCILAIHYILNFTCFITHFYYNCIEVLVNICNKLSFQMFKISLVQMSTV